MVGLMTAFTKNHFESVHASSIFGRTVCAYPNPVLELLAAILVWIANAVEPFAFQLVQHDLPSPSIRKTCEGLWQQPDPFDELHEDQVNVVWNSQNSFLTPSGRTCCHRETGFKAHPSACFFSAPIVTLHGLA